MGTGSLFRTVTCIAAVFIFATNLKVSIITSKAHSLEMHPESLLPPPGKWGAKKRKDRQAEKIIKEPKKDDTPATPRRRGRRRKSKGEQDFAGNLGEYASWTKEQWEKIPGIHRLDLIKEPFDPTIPRLSSVKPDSPYTYAMLCWHSDPTVTERRPYPGYKVYLANMLVARKLLLEAGSKADFNVVFKIDYNSNFTRLPEEDHKMMEALGIKVSYLPKTPDGQNFFVDQFNKFELWNLTQYRRVFYLDGDVLPLVNLDYFFELSDGPKAILKPNIILASYMEPSNGGFFVLEPNATGYREIRQLIQNLGPEAGRGKMFKNRTGIFGHAITPPDRWETTKSGYQGTDFDFHGGHTDQGLLYSYLKYNVKNVTQIFSTKIVHFGSGPDGSTIVESYTKFKSADNPFNNYSQERYSFEPISCTKMSWNFPGSYRGNCPPPYRDHTHYTGGKKPWKFAKPADLWDDEEPKADFYVWWRTLDQLQKEGIDIQFQPGTKIYGGNKEEQDEEEEADSEETLER